MFGCYPEVHRQLTQLIAKAGLNGICQLAGRKSPAEMSAIYAKAELLIHPADGEPFGRVLIEAMASELPVVAFRHGGPVEILEEGGGVLIPPGEVHPMSEVIVALLKDPEKRRVLGQAGRVIVKKKYTSQRHAEAMMAIYDRLLDHK